MFGQGQNYQNQQRKNDDTPASDINTTKQNPLKKQRKNRDKNNLTYFNCLKKSHFANNYLKALKAKN